MKMIMLKAGIEMILQNGMTGFGRENMSLILYVIH